MIGVTRLLKILEVCYNSMMVRNERAISLILIAETDCGKSQLLLDYKPTTEAFRVEAYTDVTSTGLYRIVGQSEKPIIIIVPDLHTIVGHKAGVSGPTVNALLSLLQDGVLKTGVGPQQEGNLQGKRAALFTALTPKTFSGKAGKWRETGFLRRLLPIYYTYSDATEAAIHNYIASGKYVNDNGYSIKIKAVTPRAISVSREMSEIIKQETLVTKTKLESRGFTAHHFFRTYCKANAIIANRTAVNKDDIKELRDLLRFTSYDEPEKV
jgi:hypothetical protein